MAIPSAVGEKLGLPSPHADDNRDCTEAGGDLQSQVTQNRYVDPTGLVRTHPGIPMPKRPAIKIITRLPWKATPLHDSGGVGVHDRESHQRTFLTLWVATCKHPCYALRL